jgi:hypothetical protein
MLLRSSEMDDAVPQLPGRGALANIPGDAGWPVMGHTLEALAKPKAFFEKRADRYGPVFRADILEETSVYLLGPEANELVLLDPQRPFSSRHSWFGMMDRVSPGGLIMIDFDKHRLHRPPCTLCCLQGWPASELPAHA